MRPRRLQEAPRARAEEVMAVARPGMKPEQGGIWVSSDTESVFSSTCAPTDTTLPSTTARSPTTTRPAIDTGREAMAWIWSLRSTTKPASPPDSA